MGHAPKSASTMTRSVLILLAYALLDKISILADLTFPEASAPGPVGMWQSAERHLVHKEKLYILDPGKVAVPGTSVTLF